MAKLSTAVTGAAGEHFVMFRLLSEGYIAALAPKGVEGVDILICDALGSHLAAVQVKTAGETVTNKWQLNKKAETITSPTLLESQPCTSGVPRSGRHPVQSFFAIGHQVEISDGDHWTVPPISNEPALNARSSSDLRK